MLALLKKMLCELNRYLDRKLFLYSEALSDTVNFKHESVHPLPWRVVFKPRSSQWHQRSCPVVVDADDATVLVPQQHVNHPGLRDFLAESICFAIVDNVNKTGCWHFDRYTFD
jgi:hypothetical protein